jgi:cytochrome P450
VEQPPGPSASNLLPIFRRDPLKTLVDIARTYGDISHFKFGRQHVYLLNNPDNIEEVLVDNRRNFVKRRGLKGKERRGLFGDGIMFSQGEFHDRQRRLIQASFYPKQIKIYGQVVTEYAMRMCQQWKDGSILDIHKELMHATLAILCKSALGSEIGRADHDEIGKAVLTTLEYHQRRQMPLGSIIEKIPVLPVNIRFQQALKKLDSVVYDMIKQCRQEEGNNNADSENKKENKNNQKINNNLISSLIHAQYLETKGGISAEHEPMSDLQLRDEIMTIMVAGHDPVANALTWTFYLISQHPDVEAYLDVELKSVFGEGDAGRIPTVEDLPKLEYVEKVFRESLRLYPPAWSINRKTINDCTIGKYVIPAGSTIITSPYVTHRDPRYFYDPNRFVPERWTEEANAQLPRFSYFPFGGGVRSCIGEPFTWMEAILIIATIAQRWKMIHLPDHRVEFHRPIITLRPKYGMQMKLERKI